ncbi:MAG: hypothetical protein TREMPRED_004209 [Tremellales sp. Tagirdzhanova-0007]|nr:MAG: hypothetical protein TREMPRED_004209 [Tremellales sp. Tagirdzhanova-0007]
MRAIQVGCSYHDSVASVRVRNRNSTLEASIHVNKIGGPEVNEMVEVPVPIVKDDEVLIKVEWTGVNFIDNYIRSGLYPRPLPYTVGQDAVGTVVKLPSEPMVSTSLPALRLGQKVFTSAPASFAEYVVALWWRVAPIPEGVEERDGVMLATIGLTAMTLVKESYEVKKGDWVLVRAAAGGVGLVLCQFCKHFGANVIATTSSADKAEVAKSHGADHVLLSTDSSEDNLKKIMELTGDGVRVVYDGVGKDTWEESFEVVRRLGTIVTFGNASGAVPPFAPLKLMPKCLKVTRPSLNPFIATPDEFAWYANQVIDVVKAGAVKFVVHKVYEFTAEDVAQAQRDITSRGTTGKLLIRVS